MLFRTFSFYSLLCLSAMLIGCSALFSAQEWSENYSLLQETRSTSPQMIDGNLETVGEAIFSQKTGSSDVLITLPEKKRIRRIVLHAENLKKFNIYVDKGGGIDGSDWQLVKEIFSVKTNPIDLAISIPFATDRVRIRVFKTTDGAQQTREKNQRLGGIRILNTTGTPGKIREIEIYGYKTAK